MSEYATVVIIAYAIFGVVILGALYLFYKSVKADFAALRADIKHLDSKLDTNFAYLEAKIEREFNALCSTARDGFANLDAKLDAVDATVDSTTNRTRRQD